VVLALLAARRIFHINRIKVKELSWKGVETGFIWPGIE
jgi:hypothetical protein